ncbi:phage capsid protein [Archangium violaceum]|uniref:phage capsid protein n=1 Tax=Archangium violaceum TaxID=83451 RepID=UPI00193C81E3|nr:phage capsid protein [Archangium violaceum]QRK06730.1 phage capsid protein [Archangium violaceum]
MNQRLGAVAASLLFTAFLSACGSDGDAGGAHEPAVRSEEALTGAGWTVLQASGPAPIRSIVRRSDGWLIGPRSSGHEIEVWASSNEGASWFRHGSVAKNAAVDFGDVTMLRIPGTATIFCAFREHANGQFRVTVTRSDNDGNSWVYDSTVVGPVSRFVGAPFLFLRANGDLQVYYDSEELAAARGYPGHQWIAMQGRNGRTGPWTAYGVVTVSREKAAGALSREGMPTVVRLGGDRLMVVAEGVEPFPTGGVRANVIHSTQSWDGGRTWDDSMRRTVYQSRIHSGTGRRYNAYAPYAIRVGNGPVGVAFCTDEDKTTAPDLSSTSPAQRQCHVGYVSTTTNFETWSGTSAIWTGSTQNYTPGLFERSSNNVIVTIDAFSGNQRVMRRP